MSHQAPTAPRFWRFLTRIALYLWGEIKAWLVVVLGFAVFCACAYASGYLWLAIGLPDMGVGRGTFASLRPMGVGLLLCMATVTVGIAVLLLFQAITWVRAQWKETAE